jgi:hypothetical protein
MVGGVDGEFAGGGERGEEVMCGVNAGGAVAVHPLRRPPACVIRGHGPTWLFALIAGIFWVVGARVCALARH